MFTLDNTVVMPNDSVYDIQYATGEVISTSDTAIKVKFPSGRVLSYNLGGRINGVRRLYWHNPVVIAPPKDATLWKKFIPLIHNVYSLLTEGR